MKPIRLLAFLVLSACLMTPVEADNKGNNKAAQKKKEEREKKRAESARKREALKDYMDPLDKNNDGSLTIDEFLAGEDSKEEGMKKFERYNKNGDRSLTKSEIEAMLGL